MNIIVTVIVAILAMAIGCGLALYLSKKNAKSQANEIIEKARLEAEVLKNNEVLKGKEKGMSIKNEAEKEANARLSKVQTSEAKLKQREMTLNQQMGDLKRRNNELDGLKLSLDNQTAVLDERAQVLQLMMPTRTGHCITLKLCPEQSRRLK